MANKFKKALALVLATAMVVTIAPANAGTVEAATKATKGTTKITASASSATITEGASKTIKVTVNKKQKKALKVTLKSSNASVAKVASSVKIKKGKKVASFKITAKSAGTAKITATTKNAKGKNIKTTVNVKVVAKEDKNASVSVTIMDTDGLQANGTGVVDDTLALGYGSGLGEPAVITWYYNEQVAQAYTRQAGNLTGALLLNTGIYDESGLLKDGKYYVVITNTAGQTYTSNTIEMVYDEEPINIESAKITDDYEKAGNIDLKADTGNSVITLKMKKSYAGDLYVYESSQAKYSKSNAQLEFDDLFDNLTVVTTESKLTEKNAIASAKDGIYYKNRTTGETTVMIVAGRDENNDGVLRRGKSYKVVFDQKNLDKHITTSERADVTAVDAGEAPYVEAPAAVGLVEAAENNPAKGGFVNASLQVCTWIGGESNSNPKTVTNSGFDSIIVYGTDSAEKKLSNAKEAQACAAGGFSTGANLLGKQPYFFVIAKTTAGVYGKESVELTSAFKAANVEIAGGVELSESETTASTAEIKLKGVVDDATVYVTKKTKGTFDKDNSGTYEGYVEVKAGDGKAEVPGVFSAEDVGTTYYAVVVPANTDKYCEVWSETGADAFKLEQSATSLRVESSIEHPTVVAATTSAAITLTGLTAYDQFGRKMKTAVDDKTATVTAINATSTNTEKGTASYKINGTSGVLTLDVAYATEKGTGAVDIKDGLTITVLGTTIKITNVNSSAEWAQNKVKVVINDDTVVNP